MLGFKIKTARGNRACWCFGKVVIVKGYLHKRTNLCCAAHAFQTLTGSHQQQVTVLVALVVDGTRQADFTRLCWNGEEAAGIDEKTVADRFVLEGHDRCGQEPGRTGNMWKEEILNIERLRNNLRGQVAVQQRGR